MKNLFIWSAMIVVLVGGSVWWSRSLQKNDTSTNKIISTEGIHWHPELEIFVDGEPIEMPENKGVEREPHSPVHTHDDLPIIHLEFGGLVREDDTRLEKWFEVWGKDFYEFGPNVTMTVNGVENTELGNYLMRDGDKIILRYSTQGQ